MEINHSNQPNAEEEHGQFDYENELNQTSQTTSRGRWIESGYKEEFSENGLQLRKWLIRDMGDRSLLPEVAILEGWDFDEAVQELQGLGLLDESDPHFLKLVTRRRINSPRLPNNRQE